MNRIWQWITRVWTDTRTAEQRAQDLENSAW
jgi:hypothetical protein